MSDGQKIIRQGDNGDTYYVIAEGNCIVSRKNADGKSEGVSELQVGDTFGEESLLSTLPRNADVTMTSDGRLMQLSKNDFSSCVQMNSNISFSNSNKTLTLTPASTLDHSNIYKLNRQNTFNPPIP